MIVSALTVVAASTKGLVEVAITCKGAVALVVVTMPADVRRALPFIVSCVLSASTNKNTSLTCLTRPHTDGGNSGMSSSAFPPTGPPSMYAAGGASDSFSSRTETSKAVSKGMKLGAPSKASSMLDSLVQEDNLSHIATAPPSNARAGAIEAPAPVISHQPIQLVIEEKVIAHLTRDGAVDAFEVKGSLALTATTEAAALSKVQLSVAEAVGGMTFLTHPKVNKQLYDQSKVRSLNII